MASEWKKLSTKDREDVRSRYCIKFHEWMLVRFKCQQQSRDRFRSITVFNEELRHLEDWTGNNVLETVKKKNFMMKHMKVYLK